MSRQITNKQIKEDKQTNKIPGHSNTMQYA